MKNKFYITTPIYYTNGIPHIWHAYTSIISDVICRYQKINWKQVKFSTWVDENSQKALQKAEELNMNITDFLDMMAEKHKSVWDWLSIKYSDFIRTTDEKHHKFVREVLQKSFDNWDIYEWEYEWMYCVWCESFKKDEDLVEINSEKVCPDHLKKPSNIKEKNYFFRLSKYQNELLDFYKENKDFVSPKDRFNEVISFSERWLEDFSISRETNKFGIKLPFDEEQVTYVWYDALLNYITVCQNWDEDFWPANLHVVWKDIIRFHAIYWPAMLMSAWYELPKQILTTGFFTIDWQKISKSLWNVIDPVDFSKKYCKELMTLYLLCSFNIGQDWDFDIKQAILTYNSKLANNLGNLVNRVVVLTLKIDNPWILDENLDISKIENFNIQKYRKDFNKNMSVYNLKNSLDLSFEFLDSLNKYADQKEPWKTIKDKNKIDETKKTLYILAEWLRQVWLNLYCFFPEKMWEMFEKLGLENYSFQLEDWNLEKLRNKKEKFIITKKWDNLFNRFEL